jgi:hypothetical protein
MADPRAFISFDFDNNGPQRLYFCGQIKNSKTPFNVEDWSSKEELDQKKWEEIIESKIKKCNMLIVLVGKKMGSATGVAKEIAFAKTHEVPIFGVYVDGANTLSILPDGLARNRTISWTWDGIAAAVKQMMTEGKNK